MTKKQAVEILTELIGRFEHVCKDEAGNTDPADTKRIRQALQAIATLDDAGDELIAELRRRTEPDGDMADFAVNSVLREFIAERKPHG
jgi:hypothetical protein